MSGPENNFIKSVHAHLPRMEDFYRMKNNNVFNSGIADCWYSGKRDLWVEYKFTTIPKRDSTTIVPGLSDLQTDWCKSRKAEGRNVLVILGSPKGGIVLRSVTEWAQITTGYLKSHLHSRAELAQFLLKECS